MMFGKGFRFRSSLVGILMFAALILACLRFVPSYAISPQSFLIVNSRGEYIQQNFVSIQEAINEAENGSTVNVPSNTYFERIIVNKTISLVGEDAVTTIIDGGLGGTVVDVVADNVTIVGFTIQNSGWGWDRSGIETQGADNCRIENNILFHTCHNIRLNGSRNCFVAGNKIDHVNQMGYGIRLTESTNCTVSNNFVAQNIGGIVFENSSNCTVVGNNVTRNSDGIRLYSSSSNNRITANIVYNNSYCGMIYPLQYGYPEDNTIFHNSFINNTNPFIIQSGGNIWDDGYPSGGNYWSYYNGTDFFKGPFQNETGRDGIGDTYYAVNYFEADRYPLMNPYGSIRNLDTNLTYLTIQSAIDSSETINGHTLRVGSGVYHENVNVYKSLTLMGENQATTIIDSDEIGTVLSVNADNVSVVGFAIQNSGSLFPTYGDDCGVFINHSTGCKLSDCFVTNNRIGIYLFFSQNNIVERNIVSSNRENGMLLWYSGNNVLRHNEISNNSYNLGVFGGSFSDFNNTIDVGNTVDGKPVQYLIGVENEIFENRTNIGVLYLINCINVTVRNLNLTRNGHGVFCFNVTNSKIENVTALESSYGIYLQDSSGNIVYNNVCLKNWVGICLQDSDYNIVEGNIVGDGEKGISLYEADNNNLEGNTILYSLYGIRLYSSHSNEIFHNNLIENAIQADLIASYSNVWDNGLEGNYWSNGANSDANKDGLGDLPQTIDDYNHDRYPLLSIFKKFRVDYEGRIYNVKIISNSTILSFAYENNSYIIRLTINGPNQTYGFCRICVPHTLMEPEISVLIDDGLTEILYSNYSVYDDGFSRWIYFTYQHSTHEIVIVSEFWPVISLSILIIATFLLAMLRKLK
ncbi:MAG: right-handed parallel beta-helix repeat-containing protein [Candidatus Bathyarchaeota archaeon]|nr:right-handed parallel beta-helix repeat-containing protein [Candidatus Bathyarchaeota archaeon]